jgi:phospholipase C
MERSKSWFEYLTCSFINRIVVDTSFYSEIMAGFDPEKIPIHKTLAAEFTIFDRWFASVPGPTQPNRLFSHMATSKGIFRNDLKKFVFGIHGRTIQKDLAKEGLTWKVYAQE